MPDASSLYLVGRDAYLARQGTPRSEALPCLEKYAHQSEYPTHEWERTFNEITRSVGPLGYVKFDSLSTLATFYSEAHAIGEWGDARVPIFGIKAEHRIPVIVYARGGAQAPAHRMQFYAAQVSTAVWEEERLKMKNEEAVVYHADMHTMCQRFFAVFTAPYYELELDPEDVLPVFNITPNADALSALSMMMRSGYEAGRPVSHWRGELWFPSHPEDLPNNCSVDLDDGPDWDFHSSLHYPKELDVDFGDAIPLYDPTQHSFSPARPDPKWKDTREVRHVYLGSQRDDYWVDSAKCPKCHQRLIIHADKAQCPTGAPTSLGVKCPDCKGTFTWP